MSTRPEDIELIIKCDDDDDEIVLPQSRISIQKFITPRGKGYGDLHIGYHQGLQYMSDNSNIIGAVADDFICVLRGWDRLVNEAVSDAGDMFIVHGRKNTIPLHPDLSNIKDVIIDEAPLWSRKLIFTTGCNWIVSFTDAWTLCLERMLQNRGIDITYYMPKMFHRHINPETDWKGTDRWETVRKDNFNIIGGSYFTELINSQADNIKRVYADRRAACPA
jgi:hypothetical protein